MIDFSKVGQELVNVAPVLIPLVVAGVFAIKVVRRTPAPASPR
jgi:hypothetical protein